MTIHELGVERALLTVITGAINGLTGIPKTVPRCSFANETFC